MSENKLVILDFETTGANITNNPDKKWGYFKGKIWHDPIELALIDISSDTEYHWYIEPPDEFLKFPWATHVHGFTPDKFIKRDDLVKFTDIYQEISRILNGKTAVAHNGLAFDKQVLEQTCEKYNLLVPLCSWRDTKVEIKSLYPDKSSRQEDEAKWMLEETYEAHSAIEDVRMLKKIIKYIDSKPPWIFV
jgi:DNA polymerase III epsilon subunit-like protein